jgi:hypothetical protein
MESLTSILIVEPDRKTRQALSTALERKGFTVVCATTAEEARRRMRRQKPRLVLLDYGGPASQARAQNLWSSTTVVLLVEREESPFAARSTDPAPPRRRFYTAERRARWRWDAYAASRAAHAASRRAQESLCRTRTLLRYSGWVLRDHALRFPDEKLEEAIANLVKL